MGLYFQQRFFSWFDSYDVYDDNGGVKYYIKGVPSFGHRFNIFDRSNNCIGYVQEEIFHLLHTFRFETNYGSGVIRKELSFFQPRFSIESNNNYQITGDFFGWDYSVFKNGRDIARLYKQFHFVDTYHIDTGTVENEVICLAILLAIDAIQCDHGQGHTIWR